MGLRENLPGQGQTEKKQRLKMPGPQLTTADLNSLLIFEELCDDWVREVHRFTSERKKKKNYVIFRSSENKKLDSLDGLKKELTDNSFLENAEFKSAFSHDIVSNKVGANKRARKAAKAWMADPTKQVTPVEEKIIAPVETTTLEEDEKPLVIDEVTTPVVEDIIEVIPAAETEKEVEEEIANHVEELVADVVEDETNAPVVEDEVTTPAVEVIPTVETEKEVEKEVTNDVEEEATAPLVTNELTTPLSEDIIEDIPVVEVETEVEDQVADSDEEKPVPVAEEEKTSIDVTPVVDAEESDSKSCEDITAPIEEVVVEVSEPIVEETSIDIEETKEETTVQEENETVETPVTELIAVEEASPAKEIEPVLREEEEKDETEVQSERKASVTSETSEMG